MNIGDITEKEPAAAPIMSLPTIKVAKFWSSDMPTPITSKTLITSKAFLLPIDESFPPDKAPIAAPRGAAVPIKEFASYLFSNCNCQGISSVKKL